jgi:hypothetical protein
MSAKMRITIAEINPPMQKKILLIKTTCQFGLLPKYMADR